MVGIVGLTSGCAFDISHVARVPTVFQADPSGASQWTLRHEETIDVGSGFPTTLRAGTNWRLAGHVPQGDVYQTADQIVTVEASNIFEAMLVVHGDRIVGFYLPVEHSFVAATNRVMLSTEGGSQS